MSASIAAITTTSPQPHSHCCSDAEEDKRYIAWLEKRLDAERVLDDIYTRLIDAKSAGVCERGLGIITMDDLACLYQAIRL